MRVLGLRCDVSELKNTREPPTPPGSAVLIAVPLRPSAAQFPLKALNLGLFLHL